ncbi:hypothetical protein BFG57_10675 [Bacillus solimangrovi]|uniref:Uncharacterized protein n=1 Tax=Bacillus solimangrovi TaxID=1305675 RepID=A0A1E5LIP2_9BACI|nr:hypothetical protein BFG57_10675 [Bacillus solimangrovi]
MATILTGYSNANAWTQDELRHEATLKQMQTDNQSIKVKHSVKGNDVYVECYIPDFHFINKGETARKNSEGYIQLSLNGQRIDNIYTAAFIVRGLPAGKHELKIALVKNEERAYGVEKTIEITI